MCVYPHGLVITVNENSFSGDLTRLNKDEGSKVTRVIVMNAVEVMEDERKMTF